MSKKKFFGNIAGKGYYIALILCAVAIGISGYLYYRNASDTNPSMQDPAVTNAASPNNQGDVQAVATQPQETPTTPTKDDTNKTPVKKPALKTGVPVQGEIVASYAVNCLSYNATTRDWRTHHGIDIAAEAGSSVGAAADGTVYTVYDDDTMGTTVVISHADGYTTKYASLAKEVSVKPGDTVQLGQTIGTVGETALLETALGSHLHFSVTQNDQPVDPEVFLSLDKEAE